MLIITFIIRTGKWIFQHACYIKWMKCFAICNEFGKLSHCFLISGKLVFLLFNPREKNTPMKNYFNKKWIACVRDTHKVQHQIWKWLWPMLYHILWTDFNLIHIQIHSLTSNRIILLNIRSIWICITMIWICINVHTAHKSHSILLKKRHQEIHKSDWTGT